MVSQTLPNPVLESYLVTSNNFTNFLAKQLSLTTIPNNNQIQLNNNSPVKLDQKRWYREVINFQKSGNHP